MKNIAFLAVVLALFICIGAPQGVLATPTYDYSASCPTSGWSSWTSFRLTSSWNGDPHYSFLEIVEFRPRRIGNHQIEFSGPWTGSVRVAATWYDGFGRMGNWGSWKVGDATIDLWTGSEDVYYKFHVSYEPVVPTTGVSAAVEYRVRCAAQSGAPHQQGDSAVTRVFDFDWDGDVDYVDFEYGFEPRYGQCKNANVTSEQCAEIDYNYDGRITIDDFEAFRGRYAGN